MKYEFNYGCEVLTLPAKVLIDKLPGCKEIELKVLLMLAASPDLRDDFESGADELAQNLGCKRSELDQAISFWRGAGVLLTTKEATTIKNPKNRRRAGAPTYTGEELEKIIKDDELRAVIDELQNILKRPFNPTEANTVVALMRYLNVDIDYLMLLFNYCAEMGKSSMRYIETTAYSLYDDGITDTEALDAYIREKAEIASFIGKIRNMLGIGGRALSTAEKTMFEKWAVDYGYSVEIVRLAYEITVDKTVRYSTRYHDKILTNWHNAGLKTLEDIEKYNESGTAAVGSATSFETDDFFEAAVKRSYESKIEKKG